MPARAKPVQPAARDRRGPTFLGVEDGRDHPGVYWIMRRDQLACMVSARRHDILDRLAASGPLSIKEIAGMIGAEPSALYHHIRKLLDCGLIVEAGHRVTRRKREQLYAGHAPLMRMAKALNEPDLQDVMGDIVGSLCRQMERDFRQGQKASNARGLGPARTLHFSRLIGSPNKEELAEINRLLMEAAQILVDASGEPHELLTLSWVMAPAARGSESS